MTGLARPHSGLCAQGWNDTGAQLFPVYRGRRTETVQTADPTGQPLSLPSLLLVLGESTRVSVRRGFHVASGHCLGWIWCAVCGVGVCTLSNRVLGFVIESVCCPRAPRSTPPPTPFILFAL